MNERLKQEIERYEDFIHGFDGASRYDCIGISQHFYNLALEDVRKEFMEWIEQKTTPQCVARGDIVAPMREGYKRCVDFIDQLRSN